MANLNIEDEEWDAETPAYAPPAPGLKVLAIVGVMAGETGKGTQKVDLEVCILQALDDATFKPRETARLTCWITDRGRRFTVKLLRAIGWDPKLPFDDEDEDDFVTLAGMGYFVGEVIHEDNGKTGNDRRVYANVDSRTLAKYTGDAPAEWIDERNLAGEEYQDRQESWGRGNSSSGGGGGSPSSSADFDADVPF